MKTSDENKYSMINLILMYMKEQLQATIDAAPGLEQNILDLETAYAEIALLNNLQNSDRHGYRIVKDEFRVETTNIALAVANAVKAHANNINDEVLLNQMKTNRSFLLKQRDTELRDRCQFILNTARPLITSIETYGINLAYINRFETSLNAFIENMGKPRLSITERKILNDKIEQQFNKIDTILIDMDINVNALAPLFQDFVNQYFVCRQIINYRGSVKAISGTIKDQSGQPLFKATFTIKAINRIAKSTRKGNFGFKNLIDAVYEVIITRPGFKTINLKVPTVKGETTKLNIIMQEDTTTNDDQ